MMVSDFSALGLFVTFLGMFIGLEAPALYPGRDALALRAASLSLGAVLAPVLMLQVRIEEGSISNGIPYVAMGVLTLLAAEAVRRWSLRRPVVKCALVAGAGLLAGILAAVALPYRWTDWYNEYLPSSSQYPTIGAVMGLLIGLRDALPYPFGVAPRLDQRQSD